MLVFQEDNVNPTLLDRRTPAETSHLFRGFTLPLSSSDNIVLKFYARFNSGLCLDIDKCLMFFFFKKRPSFLALRVFAVVIIRSSPPGEIVVQYISEYDIMHLFNIPERL